MGESMITSFDGTKLYLKKETAADNKAVIVIVHGLCEHQGRYDYFAEKLHEAGIGTYRFDHRGHGRSEGEETFYSDFNELLDQTFFQKTYLQNQILGRALLESMLLMDGKCIISALRKKDLDFYGVTGEDLEGIVSQLRNTAGVEVAIFLYETAIQEFKVSLRSNGKVDVSRVASYFGGGGHVRAAGCTMQGSVYDVLNNLTLHIEKQLKAAEN